MEILSREMIKPSSPTPQHLHKHNLSFLDQTAPPTHVSLIFFYESTNSQHLKQSLSQVLTTYYPLAGRIILDGQDGIEPPYVDCNDAGVEYVETRVHLRMSDVATEDPDPVDLKKYVWNFQFDGRVVKTPLLVQSNLFDCGGVALGVSISHNIADMASFASFMSDWSATCRQSQLGPEPDFGFLSSRFPAQTSTVTIPSPPPPTEESSSPAAPPRVAMKRFVFGKEMLLELKRVGSGPKAMNPSRVECVTAFIWGSIINTNSWTNTKYAATHAVNVRPKMTADDRSSVALRSFGNGCAHAVAWWDDVDEDGEGNNKNIPERITAKLRVAIRGIDVGKIKDHEKHFGESANVEFCIFSSWCRFPMYEVDYGWGKPHWVGTVGVPFRNLVAFLDTKDGDGVEAWVSMDETDMALVEANYKRLCMIN